jgi:2'-hydroxyisoflavone reductase
MTTRRDTLQWATALMASVAIGRAGNSVAGAPKPLKILILGGTGFLGPHQVNYALARGHHVTLFNRGREPDPGYGNRVETLLGNRDSKIGPGLAPLQGTRRWDVVIDNSGYFPRHVRDSVDLLKDRVERYIYTSTVAVYDLSAGSVVDEKSPLLPALSADTEQLSDATYGPLKAESDRIVQATMGHKATIVRANYVVGPGDETDRFTYWVDRISRGGTLLGPPHPKIELQWVDVQDLCPWIIALAEGDQAGIFNASGPTKSVSWEQVLQELIRLSGVPAQVKWATPEAMTKAGISQLPLIQPDSNGGADSKHISGDAARTVGLHYRSLADTAQATIAWWRGQPPERQTRSRQWPWPTAEQERQALQQLSSG